MKIESTARWSILYWEKCWGTSLELEDILPKKGFLYPLPVFSHQKPKSGELAVLWKPPHSDFNGWYDNRPSEILNSYVINGELMFLEAENCLMHFSVASKIKLTDLFEQVEEEYISPLHELETGGILMKATVASYTYICCIFDSKEFELIFSHVNNRLCVHFVSCQFHFSQCVAEVTKYFATAAEQKLIEVILNEATEIIDDSLERLPVGSVFGIQYQ